MDEPGHSFTDDELLAFEWRALHGIADGRDYEDVTDELVADGLPAGLATVYVERARDWEEEAAYAEAQVRYGPEGKSVAERRAILASIRASNEAYLAAPTPTRPVPPPPPSALTLEVDPSRTFWTIAFRFGGVGAVLGILWGLAFFDSLSWSAPVLGAMVFGFAGTVLGSFVFSTMGAETIAQRDERLGRLWRRGLIPLTVALAVFFGIVWSVRALA
jgi:hypothetical protein